jgi:hypothetical protein
MQHGNDQHSLLFDEVDESIGPDDQLTEP